MSNIQVKKVGRSYSGHKVMTLSHTLLYKIISHMVSFANSMEERHVT